MPKTNTIKIAIDIRRSRIRLNRNVLIMIGDPDNIQLLVNPITRNIVLMASSETNTSHRIYGKRLKGYELTSTKLIRGLQTLCPDWSTNRNYHIPGRFVESEGIIEFDMDQAIPYNDNGDNI